MAWINFGINTIKIIKINRSRRRRKRKRKSRKIIGLWIIKKKLIMNMEISLAILKITMMIARIRRHHIQHKLSQLLTVSSTTHPSTLQPATNIQTQDETA